MNIGKVLQAKGRLVVRVPPDSALSRGAEEMRIHSIGAVVV
jgi:hypothetical protein